MNNIILTPDILKNNGFKQLGLTEIYQIKSNINKHFIASVDFGTSEKPTTGCVIKGYKIKVSIDYIPFVDDFQQSINLCGGNIKLKI